MSISKFQEKFLTNKGCLTVTVVAFSSVFLFFGVRWQSIFGGDDQGAGNKAPLVVTIGDIPVTTEQVTDGVSRQSSQMPSTGFASQVQTTSSVLSNLVRGAACAAIGERDHLLSDDAILKNATEIVSQQIDGMKSALNVKPGASQKEIDDAFAKAGQKPPSQMLQGVLENVKQALSDSNKRKDLEAGVAPQIVTESIATKLAPTQQQIDDYFKVYTIKEIDFQGKPGAQDQKAQEALKAIKGGMSFEAAMDKYSTAKAPPGKKANEVTRDVKGEELSFTPTYKSLPALKPGSVSDVVDSFGGKAIFKLVSVKEDIPKDFDQQKGMYYTRIEGQKLQEELQKEIQAMVDSSATKWTNKGYKALYDLSLTFQIIDPKKRDAALQSVIAEAKAATATPVDAQPATYAWYQASDLLYKSAPPQDQAKMRDDRIEVLKEVLDYTEDVDLRMELFDLYVQKKDGADALMNLVQASKANTSYDADGQRKFGDIAAKRFQLVNQKLVKLEDLKELDSAQDTWRSEKKRSDQEAADAKKAEAEQAAKDKANQKANEELLKKQAEELKKNTASTKTPAGKEAPKAPAGAPKKGP
ncbi:MAG TPA: hypothetical protein VG944_20385 [Fimbriimonas sp.]|nr:hypothetical protein [Fimbriimonas sp.]